MDKIVEINKSVIQHGDESSRVYIMKAADEDIDCLISEAEILSEKNGYGKIIAKVRESAAGKFSISGYSLEAEVPGFYSGKEAGLFMAKFNNIDRENAEDQEKVEKVLKKAREKAGKSESFEIGKEYEMRVCSKDDAEEMSLLYKRVFKSYPFPIFNPQYIKETMDENICYYGVWHGDSLVALSSSEMDEVSANTEMTDFATHPEYRGKSISQALLALMERDMKKRGIKTAYTIARAVVPGINIVFSKAGYKHSGTLLNNTNIDGSIESMNIWYKAL